MLTLAKNVGQRIGIALLGMSFSIAIKLTSLQIAVIALSATAHAASGSLTSGVSITIDRKCRPGFETWFEIQYEFDALTSDAVFGGQGRDYVEVILIDGAGTVLESRGDSEVVGRTERDDAFLRVLSV